MKKLLALFVLTIVLLASEVQAGPSWGFTLGNEVHQLKEENKELQATLAALSLYVSAGMGDESTTAKQYLERIKEGIDRLVADCKG